MSKHDRAKEEKRARNLAYAKKFRRLKCSNCGHCTTLPGTCPICREKITRGDFARQLREL